jgi:hypothetical protein
MGKGHDDSKAKKLEICAYCAVQYILKNSNKGERERKRG